MATASSRFSQEPEYAWELATLYPAQGDWSEEAYLSLTDGTNRRIEFTDGHVEFLSMPTEIHESLVQFLFFALHQFIERQQLGKVYFSGIRLRIRPSRIRLPDVIFLRKDHYHVRHNRIWEGADLVMEVVSDDPKDRQRDYKEKLEDYAQANISEYWIADPERRSVIVHRLHEGRYVVHGDFNVGQQATSVLLPGFGVDVGQLFAVIDEIPE
jgi:Uma2 family endonuclease